MARFKVGDVIIRDEPNSFGDPMIRTIVTAEVVSGRYVYGIVRKESGNFSRLDAQYIDIRYEIHKKDIKSTKISRLIHKDKIIKEKDGVLTIKA